MRRTFAILAAIILVVAFSTPVNAGQWRLAKNVPKWLTGGTVALSYTDRDGDGTLSWNDVVVYTVTPNTALNNYIVYTQCWTAPGGTLIYSGGGLVRYGSGTDSMPLDSQAWTDNTAAWCQFEVDSIDGTVLYAWWKTTGTVAP